MNPPPPHTHIRLRSRCFVSFISAPIRHEDAAKTFDCRDKRGSIRAISSLQKSTTGPWEICEPKITSQFGWCKDAKITRALVAFRETGYTQIMSNVLICSSLFHIQLSPAVCCYSEQTNCTGIWKQDSTVQFGTIRLNNGTKSSLKCAICRPPKHFPHFALPNPP